VVSIILSRASDGEAQRAREGHEPSDDISRVITTGMVVEPSEQPGPPAVPKMPMNWLRAKSRGYSRTPKRSAMRSGWSIRMFPTVAPKRTIEVNRASTECESPIAASANI